MPETTSATAASPRRTAGSRRLPVEAHRRPLHRPAAQHVDVEVVDRLPRPLAVVDHDPEGLADLLLLRDGLGDEEEVAEERLVGGGCLRQVRERLLGDHEEVHRGLRGDVADHDAPVVLVHELGRDLLPQDLPEDGIGRGGHDVLTPWRCMIASQADSSRTSDSSMTMTGRSPSSTR